MKVGERCGRQFVLAIVFLLTLSGFFGVFSVGEDVEPRGGLYGGELRVALTGDIQENPLLADDDASLLAVSLMYDSLAKIDEVTLLPEPWVAINWTVTSNTTVEVNFWTDVEWHDSTDENPRYITGADICYSYTVMKSSPHWGQDLQNVGCTEFSPGVVEFDLTTAEQARGIFFSKLLTIPIVPDGFTGATGSDAGSGPYKFGARGTHSFTIANDVVEDNATAGQRYAIAGAHYMYIDDATYDSVAVTEMFNNDTAFTNWMPPEQNGTIRFTTPLSAMDRITANYSITNKFTNLVAFERHFKKRPYLDVINYTFFPDDPATSFDEATDGAVKAMIDNLVDFIGFEMTSGSQNALRWEGGLDETTLGVTPHVSVQTTNPKLTLLALGMNTPQNPLNDTQFRKGLSMAIKRELAVSFEASTIIADSMIHPSNTFWHNATCPKFRIQKDQDNQPDLTPIINHFQDSGYLDPDEDGYLEDPTGQDFKLTLYVPPTSEDPSKASIGGQAIGEVFNDVGVETETVYLPTDEIRNQVKQDNFSLYLSTVDVEADPIFLYGMFHSSKIGDTNDVNLNDPFLDDLLENVRVQLDQNVRQYYVKQAVCYIAETAPVGTILHYSVLESFEKIKYEGWVQMTEGVNNFWSFMNVHYQQLGAMKAQIILLVDSITAGESLDVVVKAADLVDAPLAGAWVKVTNDYSSDVIINHTGASGEIGFQWLGPNVTLATTVTFTATVRIPQYDEAIATNALTVHPLAKEMVVTVAAEDNTLGSGDETNIVVDVVDESTMLGIPGVTLVLTVSGAAGGTLGAYTGTTDSSGRFTVTFTGKATASVQYLIDVEASKEGYTMSDLSQPRTSILVQPGAEAQPGLELLAVIIVLVIILIVLILFLVAKRTGAVGKEEFEEEEEPEEELEEEEAFEEEAEVELEELEE